MALSTLLLLIKSLFPFLNEILLRDKTLKAFVFDNKTASFLLMILVVVFIIFLFVVDILGDRTAEIQKMKDSGTYSTPQLEDANKHIKELENKLKLCLPVTSDPVSTASERHLPSTPVASKGKKVKSDGENLKDIASARLKSINDNGK